MGVTVDDGLRFSSFVRGAATTEDAGGGVAGKGVVGAGLLKVSRVKNTIVKRDKRLAKASNISQFPVAIIMPN